jgi:hypothetical protein
MNLRLACSLPWDLVGLQFSELVNEFQLAAWRIGVDLSASDISLELKLLLIRAKTGKLRSRRDLKQIRVLEKHNLFELRFSIEVQETIFHLRIFCGLSQAESRMTLLEVFVKSSDLEPETARALQNLAAESAFKKWLKQGAGEDYV